MSWPKVTVVECPKGGHSMVLEDGFCEHCAEAEMEAAGMEPYPGSEELREVGARLPWERPQT